MTLFQPKGSRALRAIIAEAASGVPRGTVLAFSDLARRIGADDDDAGRALVRQSVSAARPLLLRDHNVALVAVRGEGYRVAEPGEFAGIAQDHRRKSDRAVSRAVAYIDHAPVDDMTPAERKRHEAYAVIMHDHQRRITGAEKRLADLEAVVYGPPRKVVPGEVDDS